MLTHTHTRTHTHTPHSQKKTLGYSKITYQQLEIIFLTLMYIGMTLDYFYRRGLEMVLWLESSLEKVQLFYVKE